MALATHQDIMAFVRRLVDTFHPSKVILFGSRAEGSARGDSDVDLLVIASMSMPRVQRSREMLRRLRPLPFPVDILVYSEEEMAPFEHAEGTFLHSVLSRGKVLHG